MAFTNDKRQSTELPSIVDDILLPHYFFEVTYCSGHCSIFTQNEKKLTDTFRHFHSFKWWHQHEEFTYLTIIYLQS